MTEREISSMARPWSLPGSLMCWRSITSLPLGMFNPKSSPRWGSVGDRVAVEEHAFAPLNQDLAEKSSDRTAVPADVQIESAATGRRRHGTIGSACWVLPPLRHWVFARRRKRPAR